MVRLGPELVLTGIAVAVAGAFTAACESDQRGADDCTEADTCGDGGSRTADAAPSVATDGGPDAGNTQHTYSCVPIGASDADGFFSLEAFDGALYAGQFGYGRQDQSMLFAYPAWHKVSPGLLGVSESVCAMLEFGGHLYANTEDSGDIQRTADGSHWERVHNGPAGSIGCGLARHDGQLYAVNYNYRSHNHGRILRSANGTDWEVVWDSGNASVYLRDIVSHGGQLYAFAVDEDTNAGAMLTSQDGISWSRSPTPSRMFRSRSWNGSLWLASTDRRSNGAAGVWRVRTGAAPVLVHTTDKHYVTELEAWDGTLFAGTSDGFKEDTGTSSLLVRRAEQTWETACEFPEIAAWSLAVLDDTLYVGTWQFGSGGQVYEVQIAGPRKTDGP